MVIKWILRVTHGDKNGEQDFADWIQDGTVLSKYVDRAFTLIPRK